MCFGTQLKTVYLGGPHTQRLRIWRPCCILIIHGRKRNSLLLYDFHLNMTSLDGILFLSKHFHSPTGSFLIDCVQTLIRVYNSFDGQLTLEELVFVVMNFSYFLFSKTQKPFLLLWQNLEWENIYICKWEKCLPFDVQKK